MNLDLSKIIGTPLITYFAYKYDEKQKPWALLLMAFLEIGQKRVDPDFPFALLKYVYAYFENH